MGIEKKVEEMAQLIADMVDPLHSAVKEIEASTRSRKIVLGTMLVMAIGVSAVMFHVVMKMNSVVDRLDTMIVDQAVTKVELSLTKGQLQELTQLARTGARDENVVELDKIANITKAPNPSVLRAAIKKLSAPSTSVQYMLTSAIADSASDQGTDR